MSLSTASSTAAGDPGSRKTSAADDAGVGARQHRRRPDRLERQHAEQLAEAGEVAVEQRRHRIGRAIAGRDAGPAGHQHGVAVARQPRHLVAQRLRLLGQDGVGDDREARRFKPSPQRLSTFVRSAVRLSEAVTIATRTSDAAGACERWCPAATKRMT